MLPSDTGSGSPSIVLLEFIRFSFVVLVVPTQIFAAPARTAAHPFVCLAFTYVCFITWPMSVAHIRASVAMLQSGATFLIIIL